MAANETFNYFGGDPVQIKNIKKARIIILPFCYENSPSYGSGSKQGPYHILSASTNLEDLDEETFILLSQLKIHTLPPFIPANDPETAMAQMKTAAKNVMNPHQFLLILGGDHAISIGPVLAASEIYSNLGVLQIDAHLDLRDHWNQSRFNHACTMRRIADKGIPFVQVGIRSFSLEEADYIKRHDLNPFYAHHLNSDNPLWMDEVIDALPEKVYLTVDLDGLDPSVIPGTGTPEPGGLTYREVTGLIKKLGEKRDVVAADITELRKIQGTNVSEFTAARIASKIMVYCAA